MPLSVGGAAPARDVQRRGSRHYGLTEAAGRADPARAAVDVCGWGTRDDLTVEPAPRQPGAVNGSPCRAVHEDRGARTSILARGLAPRPDTLTQTGQSSSHEPPADGAGNALTAPPDVVPIGSSATSRSRAIPGVGSRRRRRGVTLRDYDPDGDRRPNRGGPGRTACPAARHASKCGAASTGIWIGLGGCKPKDLLSWGLSPVECSG